MSAIFNLLEMQMRQRARLAKHSLKVAEKSGYTLQVIYKRGATNLPLRVEGTVGTNKAEQDEFGVKACRMIWASLPKTEVLSKPAVEHDRLMHEGTDYKLSSVEGDDAHSPFWIVEGRAQL